MLATWGGRRQEEPCRSQRAARVGARVEKVTLPTLLASGPDAHTPGLLQSFPLRREEDFSSLMFRQDVQTVSSQWWDESQEVRGWAEFQSQVPTRAPLHKPSSWSPSWVQEKNLPTGPRLMGKTWVPGKNQTETEPRIATGTARLGRGQKGSGAFRPRELEKVSRRRKIQCRHGKKEEQG